MLRSDEKVCPWLKAGTPPKRKLRTSEIGMDIVTVVVNSRDLALNSEPFVDVSCKRRHPPVAIEVARISQKRRPSVDLESRDVLRKSRYPDTEHECDTENDSPHSFLHECTNSITPLWTGVLCFREKTPVLVSNISYAYTVPIVVLIADAFVQPASR